MSFLVMKLDQCVYLLLKAMTKYFDVMESKPILKGARLQSICRFVENHFAVQSICDRVLNFDLCHTTRNRPIDVRCDGLKVSHIEFL